MIVANSRTWVQRALPPISHSQLLNGASPETDAIALLEGMVGDDIWSKFCGDQPAPTTQDFVPAQLASIMQAGVLKLDKEGIEPSNSFKDRSHTTFDKAEAMDTEHREKRTEAYRAY